MAMYNRNQSTDLFDEICASHDFIDLYLYVCTRMMDTYKNGINILV